MSGEAGYTLTETLAAMAVLALGVSGFALGMQVLGDKQVAIGRESRELQDLRRADATLERLLQAGGGPFRGDAAGQLAGDAQGFGFRCGAVEPCVARLTAGRLEISRGAAWTRRYVLPRGQQPSFVYRGDAASAVWPTGGREALRAVALVQPRADGEAVLLEARIWPEQRAGCAFDPILQDCL